MNSECIVCRMRQALDMCKFVNADEEKRQQVLQTVMEILLRRNEIETDDGEIGVMISSEIKRILGEDDPYKSAKEESIRKALEIYPRLKDLVRADVERHTGIVGPRDCVVNSPEQVSFPKTGRPVKNCPGG